MPSIAEIAAKKPAVKPVGEMTVELGPGAGEDPGKEAAKAELKAAMDSKDAGALYDAIESVVRMCKSEPMGGDED